MWLRFMTSQQQDQTIAALKRILEEAAHQAQRMWLDLSITDAEAYASFNFITELATKTLKEVNNKQQ